MNLYVAGYFAGWLAATALVNTQDTPVWFQALMALSATLILAGLVRDIAARRRRKVEA
jgi:membrane protein implicated in regulation of membrane protease activity